MTPQIEGEMNPKPNLYGIYRNMKHVQLLRVELTGRQRDRQTERQRDKKKERQTHTHRNTDRHTNTKRERGRQTVNSEQ